MSHPVVIVSCAERLMQVDEEAQKNLSAGASFNGLNISTLLGCAVSAMVLTRDRQPGSARIARTLTAIPRRRRAADNAVLGRVGAVSRPRLTWTCSPSSSLDR
jgi:hypothetical protein